MSSLGYVICAHAHCCATIIGRPGDLCPDCEPYGPVGDVRGWCEGCDYDEPERE